MLTSVLSQQISSLSACFNKRVKMSKWGIHVAYNYWYIYILYEVCIKIVYTIFMLCAICRSELMYTRCVQNVCIQIYPTFRQTFVYILHTKLAVTVLLILFTKCIQKFVEIWYIFCIHFVCILHISVVYILYNYCIQNAYTVQSLNSQLAIGIRRK